MTRASGAPLAVLPNPAELARHAADWLLAIAEARKSRLAICLSGGATPRLLYELLAEPPYRERFPWSCAHFFFGDERFAPRDSPLSNFRMVREALLSRAPVPAENIHPVPTEFPSPAEAAAAYERDLKSYYGAGDLDPARPLFDATLLGLGEDGHIASLFPGAAALEERRRWVAAVEGVKPEPRITLTFPPLKSSAHVAFLVAGEEKRAVIARLRAGDASLPAARFESGGALHLFCDAAACGG
jgi:6-phosphogluconolactonase